MSTRQSIDWHGVKCRLQDNQESLAASLVAAEGEKLRQVYLERARQFATRSVALGKQSGTRGVLTFTVGTERLCIELAAAAEVLPFAKCSPVPGAGPHLLGVINVRGRICSVLDLARILELPDAGGRDRGYIVLMRHAGVHVGLKVDRVDQVEAVTREELEGLHDDLSAISSPYIRSRTASRICVLNTGAIFSHPVFHPVLKAANATSHGMNPESHAQRLAAPSF